VTKQELEMTSNAGSVPLGLVTSGGDDATATESAAGANLSLFALALGLAGTVLGVTVVWFFAAIPLGVAAVVTGCLALKRPQIGNHRSRAVLGTVLGVVAMLLGVLSAILLPLVLHRADVALTGARDDITAQIDRVDSSLTGDVDRLDGTISRELRQLERQNHRELTQFERTSAAGLRRLERRLEAAERHLSAQSADFARLERQLRVELAALATSMKGADVTAQANIDAITARLLALEDQLGLPQPAPAGPAAPEPIATG
jgi:hypothetical protein